MDYIPARPFRKKQLECFELSRERKEFALLMRMGCVDKDTEYLSDTGWRKISEYSGGKVCQYNLDGTASFIEPLEYVVLPCEEFYHFSHSRGLDQMLSADHRILGLSRSGRQENRPSSHWKDMICSTAIGHKSDKWIETSPKRFLKQGKESIHIPTTFICEGGKGLSLTDWELRLQVAFHADGSYGTKDISSITNRRIGGIAIKKQRKIDRLRWILSECGINYKEQVCREGFTCFNFKPPMVSKSYGPEWYSCSKHQLEIIADEVLHWDGRAPSNNRGGQFFSSRKEDIDFIQYVFSSTGKRCSASYGSEYYKRDRSTEGCITITGNGRLGNTVLMTNDAKIVPSIDGKMYCFSVPSTYLVFRRNGCVFLSGNTGKSKVLLDTAGYLYNSEQIDTLIIIAPKGIHTKWVKEDIPVDISSDIDYKVGLWKSGDKKAIKQCEDLLKEPCFRILAVNIEALQRSKSPAELLIRKFLKVGSCLLAIDESDTIKNPQAKRTDIAIELSAYADYRRILTGTPLNNSPFDFYAQFKFLNPRIFGQSFTSFKHTYAEILPPTHPTIVAIMARGARFPPALVAEDSNGNKIYKNLDKLKERIAEYSFTCTLEECEDLPEKVYETIYYELDSEQRKLYNQLKSKARIDFKDDSVTVVHKLTLLIRLQQLVAGFLPSDLNEGLIHLYKDPLDNPRVQALMNILESIPENEQVIIWCRFVEEIQMLEKLFDGQCVTYYGQTKNREEAKEAFMSGKKRFWIGNTATGGVGLNLTNSHYMIYYSNDFSYRNRDQSESRQYRIGQKEHTVIWDIIAEDTIDEYIKSAINLKHTLADEMTDFGNLLIKQLL